MKRTPQQFRRENVKKLFDKILLQSKTQFSPLSINVSESLNDDFTTTDFSFEEKGATERVVTITDSKGSGFIDGLFLGLHKKYIDDYASLQKLKLVDLMVNPIMKAGINIGSDALTSVLFRVEVKNHGIAEFQHKSRSMIYSSFVSALETFQFYINCERCFNKIKLIASDAESRNRADILQSCMLDLSTLTEVNTYEQK